jgi:hypothetical protein
MLDTLNVLKGIKLLFEKGETFYSRKFRKEQKHNRNY